MADDNWWSALPFATAASAKAATVPARAKTTQQDMMMLRDSTAKAETERRARRDYAATRQAVEDMGTSPSKAGYLDAITPEQDGDFFDKVGGFLGTPLRAFVSNKTMDARDRLKTVSAQVALAGSQQMKGSSSDKDTALMRMSGVSDYKGRKENLRILDDAARQGAIEEHRASLKAQWINRFGSISAPGPHGLSYEQVATRQEKTVNEAMDYRQGVKKPALRTPPQSVTRRAAPGRAVYDVNGNPVR